MKRISVKQNQWNTPNVEHDNNKSVQFQASLMLGFADKNEMKKFFNGDEIKRSMTGLRSSVPHCMPMKFMKR